MVSVLGEVALAVAHALASTATWMVIAVQNVRSRGRPAVPARVTIATSLDIKVVTAQNHKSRVD